MSNPIQYTSRTYNTVLNDINNDPELVDTPEWWKRIISGSHDVLSVYENAIANQSYLGTAFTRQAVADLLALIDYYLSPKSTSSGDLLFYLNADTVSFPKTIVVADLAARSQGTTEISSKKYEARSSLVINATSETFTTDYASDNNLDIARVYTTGEKVRVSTTGTLPSPLQIDTDYYVIYISDTEIRLSESLSNAFNSVEITLTDDGTGTHTITLYSGKATAYQQETISQYIIGTSDGVSSWQKFDLQNLDAISTTVVPTINSVPWTIVDTLVDSESTDTHCLLRFNTDGSSYLMFGDGTYGAIPGNFDIYLDSAVGGGLESNVSTLNKINIYAGSDVDVVGVTNSSTFTGGSEAENIEVAKILGPLLLKARNRFVTREDGKSLVLAYGGVAQTTVIRNVYGILSCQVPIVPYGGGLPSSALKTTIQSYLIDRTILEAIDVRVTDPSYVTVTPITQTKILSGYTFSNVQPFIMLALDLLFSEVTYEYQQDYLQNGIESVVTLINAKWSFSFGSSDYSQIETLIEKVTPVEFGQDFQESDILGFIDVYVNGVDYITMSSPSFPITTDDDEITIENVLSGNTTEIT